MFALYKTLESLVCKLSTQFRFSLGHEGDVTLLRFLYDLQNILEYAKIKYDRWKKLIQSNFEF